MTVTTFKKYALKERLLPMFNHSSQKLLSALSIAAVTCGLLPMKGFSLDQSQYVTDYNTKPGATTTKTTTTTTTTTTTGTDKPADKTATDKAATGKGTTGGAAKPGTDTKAAATPTKKEAKPLYIVKATKHVSAGPKWNQFADYIVLKPGQENLPLTLTVTNGVDGTTPLRAIRGYLAGRDLFNEKSFKGNTVLVLDMSGALTPGSTQLVFQAWGDAGSAFSWDLTSKSTPTIIGLSPKNSGPGKNVKATGKLLPLDVKAYQITVGGKPASIVSAAVEAVEFRIPDGLKPDNKGEVTVQVTIAGAKAKPMQLKIALDPEISSFSHVSIASEQTMTITGKNFGTDVSKVKVTFGGKAGDVLSCSDTTINVRTPEIAEMPARKEVQVEIDGLKAKKPGVILFSMRNVENDGNYNPFTLPPNFED